MEETWRNRIKNMPKIDLHCHLDGSMTLKSVEQILNRKVDPKELEAGDCCQNLGEYLERFRLPLQCIQTEEGLRMAAREFLLEAAKENTKYMEVRFAPLSSVNDHLNCRQVVEAVLTGLKEAETECRVLWNVIVCAMRHHLQEDSLAMMKVCREYLGEGVCAADLAGDEAAWPMEEFRELFIQTGKLGFPLTIHAGECGRTENVLEALECGASRIGHGIALKGHPAAQKLCADHKIGIEMCPTSNLQTRAVGKEGYPIREFMDAGLLVTLNTDNRTVSSTSMTREMEFVSREYGVTAEEMRKLFQNAVEVSFANDHIKHQLYDVWRQTSASEFGHMEI